MPPRQTSTAINPIRLQTVTKLRVKRPDKQEINPCLGPMQAMLTCWASAGQGSQRGCEDFERQLRECMDAPRPPKKPKSSVNYHLARLFPNIAPPKKKKGSLG